MHRTFAFNLSIWLLLAISCPCAAAQSSSECSERELNSLSATQVTVVQIADGFFQGNLQYTISCGKLAAKVFCDRAAARIALMIETDSSGTAPVIPASLAARLYLYPLKRLFAAESKPAAAYSLTVRNYGELEGRMAAAAKNSPGWDSRHGHPTSGTAGEFVARSLNSGQLFPELTGLAKQLDYRVRVSDVEEVRTCQGLPCGALITFQFYR
jgi:hypothetical protein